MMKRFFLATILIVSAMSFLSCEKNDDIRADLFSMNSISDRVKSDFYSRVGNDVIVTDAFNSGETIELEYDDISGFSHRCLYLNGIWQYDFEFIPEDCMDSALPLSVKKAFYSLDFANEIRIFPDWGDMFCMVSRRGFDESYYDFQFHYLLDDGSWFESSAFISEDGKLLNYSHVPYNTSYLFYDLDDALGYIAGRYPGCAVKGYGNESGENLFFIQHDGLLKTVYFMNNFQQFDDISNTWRETRYTLPEGSEIPASVLEQVSAEGYEYSSVLFRETSYNGNAYGFREGDSFESTIHWIPEK